MAVKKKAKRKSSAPGKRKTGAKRSATMPDTPTFAEAGFPAVDAVTINGIVAPAGTPSDYVARLNATVQRALATPALSAKLAELGFDVRGGSADAFAEWLKAEVPKWARIIEDAGVKVE